MKHMMKMKKLFLCLMIAGLIVGLVSFDDGLHLGGGRALAATAGTISAPATIHVKRAGNSALQLRWDKVDDVSGYEIYRLDNTKKKYEVIKTISKNAVVKWTDKKRKRDITYTYKVRAFKVVKGKNQYSPFTYTVSAIVYAKTAKIVNAGVVNCQDAITIGIRQKRKVSGAVQPSSFGASKKKKVVSRKTRLLLKKNSILTKDSKGNITGKDVGTVNLYVLAHNGNMKAVKVTVVDYAKPTAWSNLNLVNDGIETVLRNQKDDITSIASYLTKNYRKNGDLYLDDDEEGNEFLSNEDDLQIAGIRDAISRFFAECPYGAIVEISAAYVDFSFVFQDEYDDITIYTISYNLLGTSGMVTIAPYWSYDMYVGI